MNTKHTIINGDSRHMNELKDKGVHLIITSPPYWQLKDYGADRQIVDTHKKIDVESNDFYAKN
jgi:site-specific DNA-methyltransferase (adenine-specific)